MAALSSELAHFVDCDRRIIDIVKDIKLLSSLSWPNSVQQTFLDDWHRGNPRLPKVEYQPQSRLDTVKQLEAVMKTLDQTHPIGRYLYATAESYVTVSQLLENLGTPAITPYSLELYGKPGDSLAGGQVHNIDAAEHFVEVTAEYDHEYSLHDADYCLSSEIMQRELAARITPFFHRHKVSVVIDDNLVSKAAAGPTRIRLRGGTCFSEYDLNQLLEHEAFVHSLTALNGREQAHFKTFGLGGAAYYRRAGGLGYFCRAGHRRGGYQPYGAHCAAHYRH